MRLSKTLDIGASLGTKWIVDAPAGGDIDADNDGVVIPPHGFLIDLSHITSRCEGRQASMMAGYRIHSVTVGIRPVDDVADNDEQTAFAGNFQWIPPTDHVKKALGLVRQVERATEDGDIDDDSFLLSTQKDYSGIRYGWDGDDDVLYQTSENIAGFGGSAWRVTDIGSVYRLMTAPDQDNALFSGRWPDPCSTQWVCAWHSGEGSGESLDQNDDMIIPINAECTGGLIFGQVTHSSGDEVGSVDDDYRLYVTVNWTPEVSSW